MYEERSQDCKLLSCTSVDSSTHQSPTYLARAPERRRDKRHNRRHAGGEAVPESSGTGYADQVRPAGGGTGCKGIQGINSSDIFAICRAILIKQC
jgi:hypothetical protein